jgi:hypothetical protein
MPLAMEVMRQAGEAGGKAAEGEKKKEEDSIPLFWRVFGGTVLSVTTLIGITAYNGLNASMAEAKSDLSSMATDARKEVTRLCEGQAVLMAKDEFATQMSVAWRSLNELKEDHKELVVLREKCLGLLARFKAGDDERRRLERELREAREEQAACSERKVLAAELARLRERLASLEGKAARPSRTKAAPKDGPAAASNPGGVSP